MDPWDNKLGFRLIVTLTTNTAFVSNGTPRLTGVPRCTDEE